MHLSHWFSFINWISTAFWHNYSPTPLNHILKRVKEKKQILDEMCEKSFLFEMNIRFGAKFEEHTSFSNALECIETCMHERDRSMNIQGQISLVPS